MKFTEILQVFPEALAAIPDKFDDRSLQDLDAVLAELKGQPSPNLETLKEWFRSHPAARDAVIAFAESDREKVKSPKPPLKSEADILQNLFERRKISPPKDGAAQL